MLFLLLLRELQLIASIKWTGSERFATKIVQSVSTKESKRREQRKAGSGTRMPSSGES